MGIPEAGGGETYTVMGRGWPLEYADGRVVRHPGARRTAVALRELADSLDAAIAAGLPPIARVDVIVRDHDKLRRELTLAWYWQCQGAQIPGIESFRMNEATEADFKEIPLVVAADFPSRPSVAHIQWVIFPTKDTGWICDCGARLSAKTTIDKHPVEQVEAWYDQHKDHGQPEPLTDGGPRFTKMGGF